MILFEPLFSALNDAEVRYVVVGGLAVVLHGHPRLTADVDIVLDLEPGAAQRAMEALVKFGLKPRAPVNPMSFADPRQRESWISEKGMQVFSLFSPENPLLSVDLFVRDPIPFEYLWGRAETMDLAGVSVRVASLDDLITMKRSAGRPQDIMDIEALNALKRARQGER